MRPRRSAYLLVVASLMLGTLAVPGRALACGVTTPVYSLTVMTKWTKKVYEPGERAVVVVTVTRPGREDPAGQGIENPSDESFPAEGVSVTTTVLTGWPYPWDGGTTDENGKIKLKMKLPKDAEGPVDTYTDAWKIHNQDGAACTEIQERGARAEYPAFSVD